jgi:hypothetical protein
MRRCRRSRLRHIPQDLDGTPPESPLIPSPFPFPRNLPVPAVDCPQTLRAQWHAVETLGPTHSLGLTTVRVGRRRYTTILSSVSMYEPSGVCSRRVGDQHTRITPRAPSPHTPSGWHGWREVSCGCFWWAAARDGGVCHDAGLPRAGGRTGDLVRNRVSGDLHGRPRASGGALYLYAPPARMYGHSDHLHPHRAGGVCPPDGRGICLHVWCPTDASRYNGWASWSLKA